MAQPEGGPQKAKALDLTSRLYGSSLHTGPLTSKGPSLPFLAARAGLQLGTQGGGSAATDAAVSMRACYVRNRGAVALRGAELAQRVGRVGERTRAVIAGGR